MIVENGKIVECTDSELFSNYLRGSWDLVVSYDDYKRRCIELGTKVTETPSSKKE